MAAVKLKQEIYKTELDKQIEEKRRQEEERRRRETEEDEKAQRAYLEQQERLRREFELEEENKLHNAMQVTDHCVVHPNYSLVGMKRKVGCGL